MPLLLAVLPLRGDEALNREPETPTWFWFATSDQKAQRLANEGKHGEAAVLFTDPARQGTAWYRAGEFEKAAGAFGRTSTPEGQFNRGNALLMMGNYEGAIENYSRALSECPEWEQARANLILARLRLEQYESVGDANAPQDPETTFEPDEIVFDEDGKNNQKGEKEEVDMAKMSEAAMRALWLRRVETRPAEFLHRKFAYQYAKEQAEGSQ